MLEDFERNVGLLLKHGFVEADNRLDSYSDSVDSIKVTGYGAYMFSGLAYSFTYLDLVCTDTGIYSEEVSNYLVEAAKEEYALFLRRDKFDRVETRLRRVETFVRYLHEEEMREREVYSLGMAPEDMFTFKCKEAFEAERARVVSSAQKQVAKARRASRRPRPH
jgi:hypothetical protein